jgi:ATP-dependent Lon protease
MSKEEEVIAQSFLDECQYVSNDDDTVYIDESALTDCMKQYAKNHTVRALTNIYRKLDGSGRELSLGELNKIINNVE